MFAMQKMIDKLLSELEAERIENARFRRTMEDILYNLEEENMPAVSSRIREGEHSIGLLVEDGAVRGNVLIEAINGASAVTIDADKINLDGKLIVETINNTSGVTIDADKISLEADSIDLNGKLIVDTINGATDVTINADKVDLDGKLIVESINDASAVTIDADKINLDGKLIVDSINGTSGVTINADKIKLDATSIDLDGAVIVDTINDTTGVSINADKIDLNGAVTANSNFAIAKDGSVSCKALSVTGGEILLPDPADGTAVLRVVAKDESGGVTIFADRIAFDGSFLPGWKQEGSFSLEQLMMKNEVEDGTGTTTAECSYVRPGSLRLTRQDTVSGVSGNLDQATYSARGVTIPYLHSHPVAKAAGMMPLYIDSYGRVCAVQE